MRYIKTPMQMRLAAERARRPPPKPLGPVDPSLRRPLRAAQDESDAALDVASAWLAHVRAGRIAVR